MYKPLLIAAAFAVSGSAAWAGDPATNAAPSTIVAIRDFAFQPSRMTVEPGTTVTWVNEDETPHTITDKDKTFRSAALDTNDRFSYTFTQPGDFTYFCTLHPMMVGTIVVKPAGAL